MNLVSEWYIPKDRHPAVRQVFRKGAHYGVCIYVHESPATGTYLLVDFVKGVKLYFSVTDILPGNEIARVF